MNPDLNPLDFSWLDSDLENQGNYNYSYYQPYPSFTFFIPHFMYVPQWCFELRCWNLGSVPIHWERICHWQANWGHSEEVMWVLWCNLHDFLTKYSLIIMCFCEKCHCISEASIFVFDRIMVIWILCSSLFLMSWIHWVLYELFFFFFFFGIITWFQAFKLLSIKWLPKLNSKLMI